jgi:hypothetical protein
LTRNVVGAPGSGPYTILGGNYADATNGATGIALNVGSYDTTHGSTYYSAGQGYVGWFINCTTGGTYSLAITVAGSGTTDIEIGSPVNGYTKPYTAHALVNGSNSIGSVTLAKGPNYIELGNNSIQAGCVIDAIVFT